MRAVACGAFALMFVGTSASGETTLIADFAGLAHTTGDYVDVGSPYAESGLQFTSSHSQAGIGFRVLSSLRPDFPGSPALYNGQVAATTTLTLVGGGEFDLLSIDIVELPNLDVNGVPVGTGAWPIAFVGTRGDGTTVHTAFTKTTPIMVSMTLAFPEFRGVVSASWVQSEPGPNSSAHQFDNVRVAPMPESTTWVLSASGLALLVIRRNQLRRSRARRDE